MNLSILIMSLHERNRMLSALEAELEYQIRRDGIKAEVIIETDDGTEPYASKYRKGLLRCTGTYVCSLDDDDYIAGNYLKMLAYGMQSNPDVITFDLLRCDIGETWYLRYRAKDWSPLCNGYIMKANQLCAWKRDFLLKIPMMDLPCFSDVPYCNLLNSDPSLKEVHLDKVLYLYRYNPAFTRRQQDEHYRKARRIADGGVDGWKDSSGNYFLSIVGGNPLYDNHVTAINAHGTKEILDKTSLQHLFRVKL